MKRLCVFCGSALGIQPRYVEEARTLGSLLVRQGWSLVYGGGHIGLMGVLADAVLEAGGEVIGVIPQALVDRELALCRSRAAHRSHHARARALDGRSQPCIAAALAATAPRMNCSEMLTWAAQHPSQADWFAELLASLTPCSPGSGSMRADGFIKPDSRNLVRVKKPPNACWNAWPKYPLYLIIQCLVVDWSSAPVFPGSGQTSRPSSSRLRVQRVAW